MQLWYDQGGSQQDVIQKDAIDTHSNLHEEAIEAVDQSEVHSSTIMPHMQRKARQLAGQERRQEGLNDREVDHLR